MAKISHDTIESIKNQVDIVDVIRHYISVQKKGKNFVAICPFHADSNPSLSISTDKQIYKCFVCGAGGNVFTFVQNYQKVSFVEALKVVSDYAGLDLPDLKTQSFVNPIYEKSKHLYEINDLVASYFQYILTTSQGLDAMNYLSDRHMDKALIDHFKIGYAPAIQTTMSYLNKLDKTNDLLDVDLLYYSSHGNLVPRFIHRLVFPIQDEHGYVIGFSGRLIQQLEGAKYVNTSETVLFKKNQVLYHLHLAKPMIKKTGIVYLVEGFMDVIAFYRAGIEHVVATMGTALTKEHIQKIKRYAKEVIIVYDGDRAGKEAALKALEAFSSVSFPCHAVVLDGQLDPDEYLNRHGREKFIEALNTKMNIMDFFLAHEYSKINASNHDDLKQFAIKMMGYLSQYGDDFAIDQYIEVISNLTKFKESTLRPYLKQVAKHEEVMTDFIVPVKQMESKYERAEKELLFRMLHFKRAADLYQRDLGFMYFDLNSQAANLIMDYYANHDTMNTALMLTNIDDQRMIDLITSIEFYPFDPAWNETVVVELIHVIKRYALKMSIEDLQQQLRQTMNQEEKLKIAMQIAGLQTQIKE